MHAPKVATTQAQDSADWADTLARRNSKLATRPWQTPQREAAGAPQISAPGGAGYDFTKVRTQSAGSSTVQETTIPLRAAIPIRQPPGGARVSLHDEPAEEEQKTAGPVEQAPAEEAEETPPVELDEDTLYIERLGSTEFETTAGMADSIEAMLSYSSTTDRGAVTMSATDFGATEGALGPLTEVRVAKDVGKFMASANIKQTIVWNTRETLGPNNQVDISGENDADLTSANYGTAVTDLTPDVADLKGRPPRTKFWAKDLTEKHEKYHVKDLNDSATSGSLDASLWLAGQSAATKDEVKALLQTARDTKIRDPWKAFAAKPAVEERAYDDGVAVYKARADAIKAKGDKGAAGGYPAPPP
jgi:hypothetical protein